MTTPPRVGTAPPVKPVPAPRTRQPLFVAHAGDRGDLAGIGRENDKVGGVSLAKGVHAVRVEGGGVGTGVVRTDDRL
jgi:hypothetical protein